MELLQPDVTTVEESDQRQIPATTVEVIVSVGILLIAALLLFYHLPQQGFLVLDEGAYVVAAKRILEEAYSLADLYHVRPGFIMIAESFYRPGFILLVILSSLLLGPSSLAGAVVSAIFGLLTVIVVYGLARQLFDRRVALLAPALLATSTWQVFHSRVGLSNATATFFWTIGLYLWVRFSEQRARALWTPLAAGLSVGYAFTCHYGLLAFLGVWAVVEAWLTLRARAYRGTVLLTAGLIIPSYVFYAIGGYVPWQELLRLSETVQSSPDPFYYLRLLWHYETPLLLIFALGGLLRVRQMVTQGPLNREGALYVVGVVSLVVLSLGAARGQGAPRLMNPLLPLVAVLAAGGGAVLMESALFRRGRTVLWGAVLGFVLLAGLYANRGVFAWHSGYAQAAAYLHTHYPQNRSACSGWWPVCEFYQLGPQVSDLRQLQTLQPSAELLFAHSLDQTWSHGVFGAGLGTVVAEFANPIELNPLVAEEMLPGSAATRPVSPTLGVIRIYDLRVPR